jgi:hypothetical protein
MASKLRSIQRARDKAIARDALMIVTLKELLESRGALQALLQQPMQGRDAFKLSKIAKAVILELETVEQTRLKMCRDAGGTLNEEENRYDFPQDADREALEKEFAELMKTDVTIPGEQIGIEILAGLRLSASDVVSLDWLIKE